MDSNEGEISFPEAKKHALTRSAVSRQVRELRSARSAGQRSYSRQVWLLWLCLLLVPGLISLLLLRADTLVPRPYRRR